MRMATEGPGRRAGSARQGRRLTRVRAPEGSVEYETLSYEHVEHVVTLTYNRPDQHNAINRTMNAELHHAWQRFRDDRDAFVLVITGAGASFSAGWDLHDAAEYEIGDYD